MRSKRCAKRFCYICEFCERKPSTKYASRPIGVTSHITPLPAGEGLGEGPLSYELEKTIAYPLPMVRMDT